MGPIDLLLFAIGIVVFVVLTIEILARILKLDLSLLNVQFFICSVIVIWALLITYRYVGCKVRIDPLLYGPTVRDRLCDFIS